MLSNPFLLPPLLLMASAIGLWQPQHLTPYQGYISGLLAAIMFAMGSSLRFADFSRALKRFRVLLLAMILQFGCMPLIAWQLTAYFELGLDFSTGLILVGCVAGGTASNLMCFLARGDVALSISLTAISTLLSVLLTPLLAAYYLDQIVYVPALALATNILQIVIIPVFIGLLLNQLTGRFLEPFQRISAALSTVLIAIIVAIIVALNHDRLGQLSGLLLALVLCHNLLGLSLGLILGLLLTKDHRIARTLAFETGMQNSGLAVVLAVKFFGGMVAIPAVLFSIIHNLSGSLLASYWARRESTK